MKLGTRVKPISYLQSHTAEIAKEVSETGEPMVITQDGEARLIVMDIDAYEQREESMALLRLLALGQADITNGRFRDADAVFKDLDAEDSP